MYLMYYLDENKNRIYTMAKVDPFGRPTFSAHPGMIRFKLDIRHFFAYYFIDLNSLAKLIYYLFNYSNCFVFYSIIIVFISI